MNIEVYQTRTRFLKASNEYKNAVKLLYAITLYNVILKAGLITEAFVTFVINMSVVRQIRCSVCMYTKCFAA